MTTKELETQERLLLWKALTRPTDTTSGSSGDNCTSLQNEYDTAQGTDGLKEPFVAMEHVPQSNNNDLGILANGECDGVNVARAAESNTAQELWDQDQELRALGISVVDQLTLERDVEAAVDKAVTQHTRKQRLQILKKEVKDISMTVKQGENKLQDMKNRLTGMRQRVVDPRLYLGVEAEARTKAYEVNTLKARHKYLQQKLNAAEDNQEELDDYDLEEGEIPDDEGHGGEAMTVSERERLIREGQMTPFGTAMTSSKTVSTLPSPGLPSHVQKRGVGGESQRTKPVQKGPTKAELISSGEMTPFGTVVKPASSKTVISKRPLDKPAGEASDFEKYLQDQLNRQKHHNELGKERKRKKSSGDPTYGVAKKRRSKPKEYKGIFDDGAAAEGDSNDGTSLSSIKKKAKAGFVSSIKKSQVSPKSRKDPLKKCILHPKKKRKEAALGSVTSNLEIDLCKETPRRILSEMVSLEESEPEDFGMDGSGSEYVPSDQDDQEGSDEEAEMYVESEGIDGSPRKSNRVDKLEQKKKRQKKRDEAEWSDDNISVTKKKKSGKSRDDGNLEDYVKRIEAWKEERLQRKQEKILRGEDLDSEEEEEDGYEEFEGGFRVPLGIWNKLYKYQRTCVRWLWELHGQGCGGILGDEMGLGKTIEVIAFLVGLSYSRLLSRHQHWRGLGPVLIVCPATVLHQWVKELHKWWPPFRVAVLHESGNFTGTRPALINNINRYSGILVTSYTGAKDQLETLLQYEWHYIILDEGHKIRNPEAQITVALKRFQTPHRLILSGSPIQNNLKELWSLFDFVFPGKLGTMPVFLQQFAVPITQGGYANASKLEVQTAFKCASMLRDTINPYLLRRMKNDVRNHLNLPDKNEQVLFCGLSEEQRKIYQEYISSDQVTRILGGRMKVFVGLINMRKICNHPDLFTGGPHGIDENWNSGLQPELRYGWWSRSGKMHVLRSVLQLWSRQEHRVLLFTQSRQMMCILERFLLDEKHSYLKMDGVTAVSSRQPLIDKFNQDPSYFVFLLTTRVGGIGVNLTGADRVVIFDPDWNPSTDTQARERAWRIGQLRHVTIYRLLTAGTIEEKIYHRQIFKQFLTNRVLKDPKQQRFFKSNDLFELFSFTEGEKEKTESSAIFAGTGSEIKLGEKRGEEEEKEEDEEEEVVENRKAYVVVNEKCRKPVQYVQNQVRTPKKESEGKHGKSVTEKKWKSLKKSKEKVTMNKTEEGDVSQSTSQMERMRELARKLSQKIGNKTPQQIVAKTDVKTIDDENSSENQKEDPNKEGVVKRSEEFSKGDDINTGNEHVIVKEEDKAEEVIKESSDSKSASDEEMLGNLTLKEECCNREMENKDSFGGKDLEKDDVTLENCLVVTEDIKTKAESSISSQCSTSDLFSKAEQVLLEDTSTSKRKHKKKDKDRDRDKYKENHKHKKGKKFEGTRIDYLVKKRNYRKTEEEEEAEKRNAKSQDEYVLDTLFKKSGVHTALSHDAILNTGDPDYLLVEGEAERVAKEALKAVRASRAYCARPRPSSDSHHEKKHRFGKKKSKFFADGKAADEKKEKSLKENKNKPMFNGGMNDDDDDDDEDEDSKKIGGVKRGFTPFKKQKSTPEGSSGIITSSQLLSRMRQRNKGMGLDSDEDGEDGYDPDYPSTAPRIEREVEPEVQENIDLLADIRNFVAFQAEVDGKASTQEIIGRFRERLPPEQTPYFKALLTQICDFHREVSGKGMWSLKGEFR